MILLQKLSQGFLVTRMLGNTPTLHPNSRIVAGLLRQYATATATATDTGTTTKTKKSTKSTKSKPQKNKSKPVKQKKPETLIPLEPKRPPTAYSLFFSDFYREKHKDSPEYRVTEIAKLAGAKWHNLPEEEKNIYLDRYKKSASDYKKSYQEWLDSLTSQQIAEENRRRREYITRGKKAKKVPKLIKDPNMPKKPKTPYIYYVIERMGNMAGKGGTDRIQELALEWKYLTDEAKKPYQEAYNKDKLRYEQEKETFKKMVQGTQ